MAGEDDIEWYIKLQDQVTNPAAKIAKGLRDISGAAGGTGNSVKELGSIFDGLGFKSGAISGVVTSLTDKLFELGETALGAGMNFAKFAFNQLAMKESTLVSFKTMLGTEEAADRMFKQAATMARLTPFHTDTVVDQYKKILAAGFNQKEAPIVFQGIADVASLNNFSPQVMDSMTRAFGQIKGKGKLLTQELNQITEGAAGAVTRQQIFKQLAGMLHIATTSVDDALSSGQVSDKMGIFAVMKAIKENASGGAIGSATIAQATTLTGLMSTLTSLPTDIFMNMDIKNMPGFKGISDFLKRLVEGFDLGSDSGKKLQKLFEGLVNSAGEFLGKITLDDIISGFNTVVDGVLIFKNSLMSVLGPMFSFWTAGTDSANAGETFKKVMSGLGLIVGGLVVALVEVARVLYTVIYAFKSFFDIDWSYLGTQLWEGAKTLGKYIFDGLVLGLKITNPTLAIADWARGVISGAKGTFETHSPSAVFKEIGGYVAEGFDIGLNDGMGDIDKSMSRMASGPSTSVGGGGRNFSVSAPITISINGSNAEELAQELKMLLPSALTEVFETLANQAGMQEAPT